MVRQNSGFFEPTAATLVYVFASSGGRRETVQRVETALAVHLTLIVVQKDGGNHEAVE